MEKDNDTCCNIHLAEKGLTNIPGDMLSKADWVESLNLSHIHGIRLGEDLKKFRNVTTLSLSDCMLKTFPELADLPKLQDLDLSGNPVRVLPRCVTRLTLLTILAVRRCCLSELPKELEQLTALQELYLSGNPLQVFPQCLTRLTQLRKLGLSACGLSELPKELEQLTALEYLNAGGNQLQDFPNVVLLLSSLSVLDLSNFSYADKKKGNSIKELPVQLAYIVALQELKLEGNPMIQPPWGICSQGLTAIKTYLKAIIPGGELMCEDTINMLGDTGAGKTSVAQSLLSGCPCPAAAEDRTRVMEQLPAKIGDKLVYVNDFGGHEIYQAFLTLFLPTNGLVLVTCDISKDGSGQQQEGKEMGCERMQEEVTKWILTALAKLTSARVVVVGTHADAITDARREWLESHTKELTQRLLRDVEAEIKLHMEQLERLGDAGRCKDKREELQRSLSMVLTADVEVVTLSCKETDPAKGLARLHSIVSQKLKPSSPMPASWCLVMKDILEYSPNAARGSLFLAWQKVLDMYGKHLPLESDDDSLKVILRYLSSTSQVIWLEGHEVLKNYVFHQPRLVVDACREVLHHEDPITFEQAYGKELRKRYEKEYKRGYITEAFVSRALRKFGDQSGIMIEFLQHFNLICKCSDKPSRSGWQYVVPINLPENPPLQQRLSHVDFKPCIKIELTFVGSVIPLSFFETNLASVLTWVHSTEIVPSVWKHGVFLRKDFVSLAMIRIQNMLEVTACADTERRDMWYLLHHVLQCISKNVTLSWKGAPPFCLITCPGCRCCGRHDIPTPPPGREVTLEELATAVQQDDFSAWGCLDCCKDIPRSLCRSHLPGGYSKQEQQQVAKFLSSLRNSCSLSAHGGAECDGASSEKRRKLTPNGHGASQVKGSRVQTRSSDPKPWSCAHTPSRSPTEEGLKASYKLLEDGLTGEEVGSITGDLFSKSFILTKEKEKIGVTKGATQKASKLLGIVLKKGEKCHAAFLESLSNINRQDLKSKVDKWIEEKPRKLSKDADETRP